MVVWEDGFIHPRRLWVHHDDVEIRHLGSAADLDVTALQLHAPAHWGPGGPSAPQRCTTEVQAQEPSGAASSRSGSGGGSEASHSSNNSAGAFKWPYMDTACESLRPGRGWAAAIRGSIAGLGVVWWLVGMWLASAVINMPACQSTTMLHHMARGMCGLQL